MSADAKQIKTKTLETLSPCIDLHILNLFTTSTLAFTIRQQNGSLQHFMETTFSAVVLTWRWQCWEHNFPCVSCRQMSVARWNVDEVGNYHHGDQLLKSRSKMCEMRCFPWLLITFFWQNQVSINSVSRSWSEFNCWAALCWRPPGVGPAGAGLGWCCWNLVWSRDN